MKPIAHPNTCDWPLHLVTAGMQIGAELIFLQDQPPGPLIRAVCRDAPMSRYARLVIRFESTARQDGLAARPPAAELSLSNSDINSGTLAVSTPKVVVGLHKLRPRRTVVHHHQTCRRLRSTIAGFQDW